MSMTDASFVMQGITSVQHGGQRPGASSSLVARRQGVKIMVSRARGKERSYLQVKAMHLQLARGLLVIAGLFAVNGSVAESLIPRSELPGLGTTGARHLIDANADPWRSLGRVQTELGNRCTGVLIAADQILTAAHCLTTPRSGQFVQPASVHVLLGYTAGRFTAHRRVISFQAGSGYRPAARGPAEADWAILRLEAPLPDAPSLPLRPVRPEDPVMLGGYQQDRPEVIMADTDCRILDMRYVTGTLLLSHSCAGTRGASGAPLLQREASGGWSVVGVAIAAARQRSGGIAIASQVFNQR